MNLEPPIGEQPRPRVLVIQNAASSGIRRFGDWWTQEGLDLHVVEAFREPIPGSDAETLFDAASGDEGGYEALVMLGGGLMPDADETAPWLPYERRIAEAALRAGVPTLGICLGGQLLAHVAGGTVRASHGLPESGSTPITIRAEAGQDPLLHDLPETVPAVENRKDAITALPAGAAWLASSERCPHQAFRLGSSAWGLQFHPEVSVDRIAAWSPDSLRARGFDPAEVLRRAEADEPVSTPIWREVAARFAGVVRARS